MAVLCPIYDPLYGWYIVDKDGNTKFLTSILYYYYSLGVSPPVGAKFTVEDYDDFEAELDPDSRDEDDDDLDCLPTTDPENYCNLAGFPFLSGGINQTPPTAVTVPYAHVTLPNHLVNPAVPFINQQPSSYTYPNQLGLMTESYNSYSSFMLPLPLSAAKMTMDEAMDKLYDQDEFEEDSIM